MTIILHPSPTGWIAEFLTASGQPDPECVAALGTHLVRTAFTSHATEERVRRAIEALNPGASVAVGGPLP